MNLQQLSYYLSILFGYEYRMESIDKPKTKLIKQIIVIKIRFIAM